MLKLIHCADLHLGSAIDSSFNKEVSNQRRLDVLDTFVKMVKYATENGFKVILISGDAFDTSNPLKKDKEWFYSVIKNNPQIDFIYLKGNHDNYENNDEKIPNLKTFTDKFERYTYGDVDIWGMENLNVKSTCKKIFYEDRINIVMAHGDIYNSSDNNYLDLSFFKNANIDYLALGHLHSYKTDKLDDRCNYVYSGCLEGRGYDECGEKGFVEIIINRNASYRFVPFSRRIISIFDIDVSNFSDDYEVVKYIQSQYGKYKERLVRLNLVGGINENWNISTERISQSLENDFYSVETKNSTYKVIDVSSLSKEMSLRGEFVRSILSRQDITENDKNKVIELGLNAFRGTL